MNPRAGGIDRARTDRLFGSSDSSHELTSKGIQLISQTIGNKVSTAAISGTRHHPRHDTSLVAHSCQILWITRN